jgi:hypothetical protein
MIVTTAGKNAIKLQDKAKMIAASLNSFYMERGNHSISSMIEVYHDDVMMIGVEKISYHPKEGTPPLFFHPNSSMFRVKQVLRGEEDSFINACRLKEGMSLLDCTMGLGSDSIVASLVAGKEGCVTGIESSKAISFVVKSGLHLWNSKLSVMNEAMRRVQVINDDHLNYLKTCQSNSYDVVYFDPMFESTIQSPGLSGLKGSANYSSITKDIVSEAIRVASQRVVMKDNRKSSKFTELGFDVIQRNAGFLYGVIEKNEVEK